MKPAPLTLHIPRSPEEALDIIAAIGDIDEVKILAGGQSLVPVLALRLAQPMHLIDINGLGAEFAAVEHADGVLRIGGLVRHRELERSAVVAQHCPLISEAVPQIAHPAIRNRGTIGGSLAHADPAAELPAVVLALDAQIRTVGPDGARTIPAGEFFQGFMTTALEPAEILVGVDVPDLPPNSGTAFVEVSRRPGDFALVAAAAVVTVADGRIVGARLTLAGVGDRPIRMEAAEAALRDVPADVALVSQVARSVTARLNPHADGHAPSAYRRHVAGVVSARALLSAYERAVDGAERATD